MSLETTANQIQRIVAEWRKSLKPPEKLKISEWADKYRRLSSEASSEPGQWSTDRAPYQREMMDVILDDDVRQVVVVAGSQLGKSEGVINNAIGYHIHMDPCPMLFVLPSDTLAEDYSKERIAPMLRDTPVLADIVGDPKSRNSSSTILKKVFPGGVLTMLGANTPRKLASKPIRIVFFDEVDGFVEAAGKEGDPISLAQKRTATFPNFKWVMTSTPTDADTSRIKAEFQASDQRYYNIPCPHCNEYLVLEWAGIQWDRDKNGNHLPETARYVCEHCGTLIYNEDKFGMLEQGVWIATAPFNGIAGFRINSLYSPFLPWSDVVREFLKSKDDPEKLKVFVNTALAEWWEDQAEKIEDDKLYSRREVYPAPVPYGAMILTAGVDVQEDRLEVEIKGWGKGEENWTVDYRILYGPTDKADVWTALDDIIFNEQFEHESGMHLMVSATGVDSGFRAQIVYDYCKQRKARNVFPTKGQAGEGVPIIAAPKRRRTGKNRRAVDLFMIGTDEAKGVIYARLKRTEPGHGYYHFPNTLDEEYFKQLAGEKMILKKHKGHLKREWVKTRARNEALDTNVINYAMVKLLNPNFEALATRFPAKGEKVAAHALTGNAPRRRTVRSRGIR